MVHIQVSGESTGSFWVLSYILILLSTHKHMVVGEDYTDFGGYIEVFYIVVHGDLKVSPTFGRVHLQKYYQLSIGMAPYKALYVRWCRIPICWNEDGDW